MTAAAPLPATIASRYLPVRQIGRGGMGVVYEVVHARTGEHLALKVLLPGAGAAVVDLHRFKQEARASARIKSEHVVRVLDADTAAELDGAPFLVMELLDGLDLEQAATLHAPDRATVVDWLRQIAPALDKAHRLGIIHRDLKPENMFLAQVEGRTPIVKILDFGIAKISDDASTATASGQVLGTPRYMAPEQVSQDSKVTGATDLYALGLVAYRLIVGENYYRGPVMGVLAELLHGVTSAPSSRHPQLGSAFDGWFLQACHRDPARRFASASQQIEALAAALGLPHTALRLPDTALDVPDTALGLPAASLPAAAKQRTHARRPLLALLGAAVLLSAAVFSYFALTRREPTASATPEVVAQRSSRPEAVPPASGPPRAATLEAVPPGTASPRAAVPDGVRPQAAVVATPTAPGASRRRPPALPETAPSPPSPRERPFVTPDPYQDQK